MSKDLTNCGEALGASQTGMLVVESFLKENYQFRFNVLNGKVEFVTKSAVDEIIADNDAKWRPLTDRALKSIIIRAKREDVCEGDNPKGDIQDLVQSEEVRAYDPIGDYLNHLPHWDGQNHVARLFGRLPGISSEQAGYLSVWLRSTVAHWLQIDTLHGIIRKEYPSVKNDHTTKIRLGKALTELGFEHKEHSHVAYYRAVPRKVA